MVPGPVRTRLPGRPSLPGADCVLGHPHAGHGPAVFPWQHHRTTQVCLCVLMLGFVKITVLCVCFCRARFHPQCSERDAARAITEVVETACLNFRYVIL